MKASSKEGGVGGGLIFEEMQSANGSSLRKGRGGNRPWVYTM